MKSGKSFEGSSGLPAFSAGYWPEISYGWSTSPATTIAATCCCTRARTSSWTPWSAARARRGTPRAWPSCWPRTGSKHEQLTLNDLPRSRDEVPKWGRIEMIQAAHAAGRTMSLEQIFGYDARASLENQSYGWCWAAAVFFDRSPAYQSRFSRIGPYSGRARDFADRSAPRSPTIGQRFASAGNCSSRISTTATTSIAIRSSFARIGLPAEGAKVEVQADRSWQSSGVRLEAGKKYLSCASGRYQVAHEPKVWWCEPGGVTIRYHHGQPLGILLAAVRADESRPQQARRGSCSRSRWAWTPRWLHRARARSIFASTTPPVSCKTTPVR